LTKSETNIFSGKNVLIIDDELLIRETLKDYLETYNIDVDTAQNGEEGLKKVKEKKFDFVVCDIRMPETSGLWFLEQVRKSEIINVHVIMMSAFQDIGPDSLLEMGAQGLIHKPADLKLLLDLMAEIIEGHSL
jgi:two-component system nitrogen regulation response regulator NtrX